MERETKTEEKDKVINYQTLTKKKDRPVGEMSEKFTPKVAINLTALKTSIKMPPPPPLFYSS